MVLHLLGKKSWNVYNADNIARVRRDEADAAAREEAEDQRAQQEDARRLVQRLRGEPSPSPSSSDAQKLLIQDADRCGDDEDIGNTARQHASDSTLKRRRRRGEDDTDRDIRYARALIEDGDAARGKPSASIRHGDHNQQRHRDAPLHDADGHFQLFPETCKDRTRDHSPPASKRPRKSVDTVDKQGGPRGMRFNDAAGYKQDVTARPWYAAAKPYTSKPVEVRSHHLTSHTTRGTNTETAQTTESTLAEAPSKNVWGNADPRRIEREQQRLSSSDPFAAMQRAQRQLKQSERDRQIWDRAQKSERSESERQRHHSRRDVQGRKATRDLDDVDDGFRLDNSTPATLIELQPLPGADRRDGHTRDPTEEKHHRHRHHSQHHHRQREHDKRHRDV